MSQITIKQIIKESKLEEPRIVYNYENELLPSWDSKTNTDKAFGTEYNIEFTYIRPKDSEANLIKNIVEDILDDIDCDRHHIVAYKFNTSNVMKSIGGRYYWNRKFEDTGRNRCKIIILTDDGNDKISKPMISSRENWIVLQPEKVKM